MKIRLVLFVAFTLLCSACATSGTPQAIATISPTSQILPTSEPTQPPVQAEPSTTSESTPAMTTYTDDFAGFSLEYPANWFINASAAADAEQAFAYSISIATWDLRNPPTPSGKGQNGMPEGEAKIDVGVVKQSMTLEEAIAQQRQNESGSTILARKDVTLANGLLAVILDVEGMAGPTRTLVTVLNGNIIYVSGYGNLEHFEDIALSLRAK